MTSRKLIDEFLAQKSLALVGISRSGRGFGNSVWKELKSRGYTVFPVHLEAAEIGGERCWPSLLKLPAPVGGVVVVVPPPQTEKIVRDAVQSKVPRVWMQGGSESAEAIAYCEQNGVAVVHHECILMFAEPKSIHRFHRFLRGLFGEMPK